MDGTDSDVDLEMWMVRILMVDLEVRIWIMDPGSTLETLDKLMMMMMDLGVRILDWMHPGSWI